ncbi:phosphoenolpyruvate carboxykinase (GTP) [Nocardia sp. NBC_01503]|uniref:phosphoenolpyruvate carboxykinase (GTP) n=1 Tax=Nocardia sp. NBC_01503 TaxID=2975997 RepID=UPI002E7B1003|nr:phosphoenolpyruvate carboxykinase (GTP) [Nocardia sp. NBC_01503]WTL32076.1 phosphoenolpyruvate carboxykinase (GTP) [Nocardia sp. NBC_01503]
MTVSTVPGMDRTPCRHTGIADWVDGVAGITEPDRVVWCDGSADEWHTLTAHLVEIGAFGRLPGKRDSFECVSDSVDIARIEDRTFICSYAEVDAGPTNNWMDPVDMKVRMTQEYRGAMAGRTLYVIAFCLGPLDADEPKYGVQITDSEYVAASMHSMSRSGATVWERLTPGTEFFRCLHSVGAPLKPGQRDVPWPCDHTEYFSYFPQERTIWSYGVSGHMLLGTKRFPPRIASAIARAEGWLVAHMLILEITSPERQVHYIAAAFPSSCGKTNLAMLEPALEGWTAETIGDGMAWLRFGADGRLCAVDPEAGFSGGARGPCVHTYSPPVAAITGGTSKSTNGVPISAIFFGGRRATTVPLVTESFNWRHGVFLASILSSETTGAATGSVDIVRRDPMAMLPFLGYHVGDYLRHWLDVGAGMSARKLPKIFYVNWFRRADDGTFLWPGYGENVRVLKWALQRIAGAADAQRTPVGFVPTLESLDLEGLDIESAKVLAALAVDPAEWAAETWSIGDWYSSIGATKLPFPLRRELAALKRRLAEVMSTEKESDR